MSVPDPSARRSTSASRFHDASYLWGRAKEFRQQAAEARDRVAADELVDLAGLYAAEAMRARLEELMPGLRRP